MYGKAIFLFFMCILLYIYDVLKWCLFKVSHLLVFLYVYSDSCCISSLIKSLAKSTFFDRYCNIVRYYKLALAFQGFGSYFQNSRTQITLNMEDHVNVGFTSYAKRSSPLFFYKIFGQILSIVNSNIHHLIISFGY